jgi:hypothetical protein
MGIFMSVQSKGQTFSTDFIIACTIFVLAVGLLLLYWRYTTNKISETNKINDMIEKAYLISEIWFRDGIPKYWDSSNVIDIGLSNEHRFNKTKMDSLNDPELGYENVTKLIGVEVYNYNFTVYNMTKNVVYTFGQNPSNPDNLVKIKRVGILDGKIVNVDAMVWL